MKLTCAGSKKSPTYYVQKSVRIGTKTTTKTVERLGSIEEIKARCGDMDPIEWAKEYTKKLTLAEKGSKQGILLKYSASMLIDKNVRRSCNVGYLFLQDICCSLGTDKICDAISEKYKFDYDLNDILSMLIYSRIIAPGSKLSSLESAQNFLEQPKCNLHQIYRALGVIAKENDFFQAELYKNSQSVIARRKEVLYYDCTNYYLENFGLSNTKNKREKHRAYNRCIADTSRLYALCFSLLTPEGVHAVKPQSISGGSGRGCRAFHPISPANL